MRVTKKSHIFTIELKEEILKFESLKNLKLCRDPQFDHFFAPFSLRFVCFFGGL
jgi:hypothetical protein